MSTTYKDHGNFWNIASGGCGIKTMVEGPATVVSALRAVRRLRAAEAIDALYSNL